MARRNTKLSYNDIYINLVQDITTVNFPNYSSVLKIYQKYLNRKYPEGFLEKARAIFDAKESFIRTYDDKFKNQLQFEIEEVVFEDIDYILSNIVKTYIDYINSIFDGVESIMKEAGIHE